MKKAMNHNTMKRLYTLLLATVLVGTVGCKKDPMTDGTGPDSGAREVEINISTGGAQSATRAPLDGAVVDAGNDAERTIATLDLLVFDQTDKYLYRREAYKVSSGVNTYRALLRESTAPLNVYLLANVREQLVAWDTAERVGTLWSAVQTQLIDTNPSRLVGQATPTPLPMFGRKLGQSISTDRAPSTWGQVEMRRSVASADVYVADVAAIRDVFELKGLLAFRAPDRGYFAAIEDAAHATPIQQYLVPPTMTTSLDGLLGSRMHATTVMNYVVASKEYKGVAYQMYFYDNPAVDTDLADGDTRRPTRLVVAGKYETSPGTLVDAYYPLDLVDDLDNNKYRPAIRNWKYEFLITSVSGPGYRTPEDAANGPQVDLNVEIKEWSKDDVAVGVRGHYYLSMLTKDALLGRLAGSTDNVDLTYEILDGGAADFTYNFQDQTVNNPQTETDPSGKVTAIENDWFRVELVQTPGVNGGTAYFEVTARDTMEEVDGAKRVDHVVVRFRELEFVMTITQINGSPDDWGDGGDIPAHL